MIEPPKSTYPIKMHGAVLRGVESAGTPGDVLTVNGAPFYSQEYLDKAIEAEREDILRVIDQGLYLDGSYIETSGDEIYLISQAIRNRSNTTTERNGG